MEEPPHLCIDLLDVDEEAEASDMEDQVAQTAQTEQPDPVREKLRQEVEELQKKNVKLYKQNQRLWTKASGGQKLRPLGPFKNGPPAPGGNLIFAPSFSLSLFWFFGGLLGLFWASWGWGNILSYHPGLVARTYRPALRSRSWRPKVTKRCCTTFSGAATSDTSQHEVLETGRGIG